MGINRNERNVIVRQIKMKKELEKLDSVRDREYEKGK